MWWGIKRSSDTPYHFVHGKWAANVYLDGWPVFMTQDINEAYTYCDFLRGQWPSVGYYVAEKTD